MVNLDASWVWPYWLERQLDPASADFVPGSAGGAAGNVTHRSGMLVGNGPLVLLPPVAHLPLDRGEQRHSGRQARVPGQGPDEPDGFVPAAGPDQFKDRVGL